MYDAVLHKSRGATLLDTEQIDELLARYTAAESRIAANLLELDSHPTFKILSGGGLAGQTKATIGPLMTNAGQLWEWLARLQAVLRDAKEIRDDGRMNAERRARLTSMLTGQQILLAVDEKGLDQRGLLDEKRTELRVTIEHLLTRMRETYEPIRDGVASVDQVWTEVVPRTDSADTTLQRLKADIDRLGIAEPTISVLERRLVEVRKALADDPLSLEHAYAADLDGLVADAARETAKVIRGHDELDGDVAAAETHLAEVRVLRTRAATAHTQSTTKIVDPQGLVRTPDAAIIDGPNGLAARMDELRSKPDLQWQQKRQLLDSLMAKVVALREQLSNAYHVNSRPLNTRDELRGLLAAYSAKAAATGRAEDLVLADLHDDAYSELFTSPTDLDRAASLVSSYGEALR